MSDPSTSLSCAEPLLREAVPRQGQPNAKVFVLAGTLAALTCMVLLGQVGENEEHRMIFEPEITASVRQGSVLQPPRVARAWQRTPLAIGSRQYLQPVRALTAAATQEDLKKKYKEQKENIPTNFDVKALRSISKNGANVPEGTRGILESDVILWENEEYTAASVTSRGLDYEIAKRPEPPPDMSEMLGKDCTDADMKRASADLSGLQGGDMVLVLRPDGRWTYAIAVGRSGFSRSQTGVGFSMKLRVEPRATEMLPYREWDKIKQLKQPDPGKGIMGSILKDNRVALSSKLAASNPLQFKIGQEVSEEELQKASPDLSSVLEDDIVAVLRSSGKWTYARLARQIGAGGDSEDPFAPGKAWLLRVDRKGSEKKVLSSELAETVKNINAPRASGSRGEPEAKFVAGIWIPPPAEPEAKFVAGIWIPTPAGN